MSVNWQRYCVFFHSMVLQEYFLFERKNPRRGMVFKQHWGSIRCVLHNKCHPAITVFRGLIGYCHDSTIPSVQGLPLLSSESGFRQGF